MIRKWLHFIPKSTQHVFIHLEIKTQHQTKVATKEIEAVNQNKHYLYS